MYGDEVFIINSAIADAALATGIDMNAALNTAALVRTMEAPGGILYWGYRPTTTFAYDTLTAQGVLTLRRYSKVIKTAVVAVGGTGYAVGDQVSVTGTGASGGVLEVTAAPAGVVTAVKIVDPGVNYYAGTLATVVTRGSGDNALTVTVSDLVTLDTMLLADASLVGYLYMRRCPNPLEADVSPTPPPPASFAAGEKLEIFISTAATGGAGIAGVFQPIIIVQNRGENFAAQGLWVEATNT
jgi:hypothetical protein